MEHDTLASPSCITEAPHAHHLSPTSRQLVQDLSDAEGVSAIDAFGTMGPRM